MTDTQATTVGPGTAVGAGPVRRVYIHDVAAPKATAVVPSVFVAARDDRGRLLLVRRADSGAWELPGGRVDVGESMREAGVRETVEESGVLVRITGVAGLFTDPGHVVVDPSGTEVRQQFVVCLRARAVRGVPVPDLVETIEAAWFDPAVVGTLRTEPGAGLWIPWVLSGGRDTHLD
ncbi:NUDIX domain-containing protein [Pseudonocardia broussonetiae]|uniref:NUDIX domain-containing protein n=1 Tax=Pseudonocardia broussonetiae TaxID=2736640 RepID=A0A6M6JPN6_9PSEU|nr:NUDIX domain-containing protein [Pseudonocardia broussonetiae]QJY49193.1 NUDIX domain-containing protein [Pseudonocardia broussonetiae]